MNDEINPESPVVPEQAPEHGPDFWNRLDVAMQDDTSLLLAATPAASPDATAQMPQLRSIDGVTAAGGRSVASHTSSTPARTQGVRARWPLAAAAVALVVLGLGFLAVRSPTDPGTTTEVVSAADPDAADPDAANPSVGADAAEGVGSDGDGTSSADAAPDGDLVTDDSDASGTVAEDASTDTTNTGNDESQAAGDVTASTDGDDESGSAVVVATPVPAPPIPDFDSALGATGDPEHLPLDGAIAADSTYLANWSDRRLTWYAATDSATNCANADYSEILYVNNSGITQEMRDPQPRFSGEISHYVVNSEQELAAWIVACGNQLELFVATLEPNGSIDELTLAWLGEGSTSTALVLWDANEVSLNAIEPNGAVFSVDYNVETGLLSRNGGPPRIMLEAGAPAERSLTPIAASPDGGLTYWTGTAAPGTVSECLELYGSGQSDTLWLRQGEGQWRLAAAGDFPLGLVTAAALDSNALRMAFADVCPGESGRVLVGTQLADGRLGDLREIDLTPFVPGYAAQLFWVDDMTLRIETDNTEFGFGTVRFDYRLDQDLIVQLD